MKKVMYLVLALFVVLTLSSCERINILTDIINHVDTIDSFDTYVILIDSNKGNSTYIEQSQNFVYVDNKHKTFLVSNEVKETVTISCGDVLFEEEDNELYGYVCDDNWTKYPVDSSYLNVKYLGRRLFENFKDVVPNYEDGLLVYKTTTTLNTLNQEIYSMMDKDFTEDDYHIEFPLQATYDQTQNRFISFEIDLTPIFVSKDSTLDPASNWLVTISFEDLNSDFNLQIENEITDDYLNDFNQLHFLGISKLFSFDIAEGSIEYENDIDILKVEFEETGLYQLKLLELLNITTLKITILDENKEFVRMFEFDCENDCSSYWAYTKGIYYILVSGDEVEEETTQYRFLFLSN